MKIAIMQPYLFPYLGYFQLIKAVDTFVFYDDVNFINRGWINRNRIIVNKHDYIFTLPLIKSSQNKLINEIEIFKPQKSKEKLIRTIDLAYKKAPQYNKVNELIEDIILFYNSNLSEYIINSITKISKYLNLDTRFVKSSELPNDKGLKGQNKIIDICKIMKAETYINPIGGVDIYSKDIFEENSLKINFIKSRDIKYTQFTDKFLPNLSIIDILMFNNVQEIDNLSNMYDLI